jgi:hypothetical protein
VPERTGRNLEAPGQRRSQAGVVRHEPEVADPGVRDPERLELLVEVRVAELDLVGARAQGERDVAAAAVEVGVGVDGDVVDVEGGGVAAAEVPGPSRRKRAAGRDAWKLLRVVPRLRG